MSKNTRFHFWMSVSHVFSIKQAKDLAEKNSGKYLKDQWIREEREREQCFTKATSFFYSLRKQTPVLNKL